MIVRSVNKIKELAASHEDKKNPGAYKKILYEKTDIPDSYSLQMVNWARIPVKKKFNPHYHQDMIEIFIIQKGKAKITVNGEVRFLKAGDSIMVLQKELRSMENVGLEDVEYL